MSSHDPPSRCGSSRTPRRARSGRAARRVRGGIEAYKVHFVGLQYTSCRLLFCNSPQLFAYAMKDYDELRRVAYQRTKALRVAFRRAKTLTIAQNCKELHTNLGWAQMKEKRYGDGRVCVICRLDTLQVWVTQGRSLRSFYDKHQAALPISYSHFTRLAKTYLPDSTPYRPSKVRSATSRAQPPPTPAAANPVAASTSLSRSNASMGKFKRFEYDPLSDISQLI